MHALRLEGPSGHICSKEINCEYLKEVLYKINSFGHYSATAIIALSFFIRTGIFMSSLYVYAGV